MEEKVKSALDLIEEDADTFAKKAEMYYQRRPELINFIRESYRSYRALAERYDHLSGELHKANNTIATVFPDQVHFGIEDEEEDSFSESGKSGSSKVQKVLVRTQQISLKRSTKSSSAQSMPQHKRISSQMSADHAHEEVDKLQRGILALQTEKEFVKSSYESGLAKYMDIEKRITEMQERVCSLQDEFSAAIFEDDEARALMVATALRSCEDTLVKLHEQQKKSTADAIVESQRIKNASEKLRALKCYYGHLQVNHQDSSSFDASEEPSSADDNPGDEVGNLNQERLELNSLYEKVRNNLKNNSEMSAIDLAEKIDGLVNKVIALETIVSSQTAQIERLRCETEEFHKHLQSLEEEKTSLIDDSNDSSEKLRQAEEELYKIQQLDKSVREEGDNLKTLFREAYHTFHDLSNRLQFSGQKDELKATNLVDQDVEHKCSEQEILNLPETTNSGSKSEEEETHGTQDKDVNLTVDGVTDNVQEQQKELKGEDEEEQQAKGLAPLESSKLENGGEVIKEALSQEGQECIVDGNLPHESKEHDDTPSSNWQQLFLDGLEDREKILLAEYTSVLRNYREARQKLTEADKKHQDHVFQTVAQMRDLRNAFVMKDEENQCLRKKLSFLESGRKRSSFANISETTASNDSSSQSTTLSFGVFDLSDSKVSVDQNMESSTKKDCERLMDLIGEQSDVLPMEEKFRRDIDNLLDENLEFWLRFGSSFQQIQKYKVAVEDLHAQIAKLKDCRHLSSTSGEQPMKPEASSSIHKQLKELQSDLSVWIEQNALLKDELHSRCSSLSDISKEITRASTEGVEGDELQFTAYQASKFQGEVVDMQQENNKVANELQAGLDHVRGLQSELGKALVKLNESFELSTTPRNYYQQQQSRNLSGRAKIPLRSFLFGVKPKPKKPSIFSCMNQALQKQYSDLSRPGLPP